MYVFILDLFGVYLSMEYARRYLETSLMPPYARSQIEGSIERETNIRSAIENDIRCPAWKPQLAGSADQLAFAAF